MARMDPKDLALLCKRLSRILKGNLSILNALEITGGQTADRRMKRVTDRITAEMKRGESFAEGVYISGAFDPCFVRCVKEAEENNRLTECLESFEQFYREEDKRERVLRGSVYLPVMISVGFALLLIFIIMFVYPHFMAMFGEANLEIPKLASGVLFISKLLGEYWEIFLLIAVGLIMVIQIINNSSLGQRRMSRLVMESGSFGNIKRLILFSRFARLFAMLRRQNIPDREALNTLADSFEANIYFSENLYRAAENCAEGVRTSSVLRETGIFPADFIEMLALGEELGDINGYLEDNALICLEEAERAAEKRLGLWEPLLILTVAIVLIIITVSLTAPMTTLFDEVSRI
ncbi:MAG TPA: hypothetical protein DCW47_05895 [Lachnospiraceae bacterium]|nr:hypothetical protein [Lachnospiraceae bacterium]